MKQGIHTYIESSQEKQRGLQPNGKYQPENRGSNQGSDAVGLGERDDDGQGDEHGCPEQSRPVWLQRPWKDTVGRHSPVENSDRSTRASSHVRLSLSVNHLRPYLSQLSSPNCCPGHNESHPCFHLQTFTHGPSTWEMVPFLVTVGLSLDVTSSGKPPADPASSKHTPGRSFVLRVVFPGRPYRILFPSGHLAPRRHPSNDCSISKLIHVSHVTLRGGEPQAETSNFY